MKKGKRKRVRVLLVGADGHLQAVFCTLAREHGIRVVCARDAATAIAKAARRRYRAVFSIYPLPGLNGISLFFEIRRAGTRPIALANCILLEDSERAQRLTRLIGIRVVRARSALELAAVLRELAA